MLPGYELSIQFNNFLATQNQAYSGQTDFSRMVMDEHFEQARRMFDLQFGGIKYGNTEILFSEADFMGQVAQIQIKYDMSTVGMILWIQRPAPLARLISIMAPDNQRGFSHCHQ